MGWWCLWHFKTINRRVVQWIMDHVLSLVENRMYPTVVEIQCNADLHPKDTWSLLNKPPSWFLNSKGFYLFHDMSTQPMCLSKYCFEHAIYNIFKSLDSFLPWQLASCQHIFLSKIKHFQTLTHLWPFSPPLQQGPSNLLKQNILKGIFWSYTIIMRSALPHSKTMRWSARPIMWAR